MSKTWDIFWGWFCIAIPIYLVFTDSFESALLFLGVIELQKISELLK